MQCFGTQITLIVFDCCANASGAIISSKISLGNAEHAEQKFGGKLYKFLKYFSGNQSDKSWLRNILVEKVASDAQNGSENDE